MEDKLFKGGTMQNQFNLIDEPWILVREPDDQVQKVSIRKLFKQAQSYTELAGETAPQDFAVLRILLAISVVVLMRWDENGNRELLDDEDDAFDRWKCVWKQGHYPSNAVDQYLDEVKDRFWLLSDSYRFMQHEIAKQGTTNLASKLIGDISESANKSRLFQSRSGDAKIKIAPDAAARWLINLNAFDDNAYKPSKQFNEDIKSGRRKKDSVSPGIGWVGKLGAIYAKGGSLFETLMLNSILLKNGKDFWSEYVPQWEKDNEEILERNRVIQPNDFCALMTFPSRRLWLNSDQDGMIIGVSEVGGDYFLKENALVEPFTLWKNTDPKKKKMNEFVPRRHDESRLLWQDFQAIVYPTQESKTIRPGVVDWVEELEKEDAYPSTVQIEFVAPAVVYGDKDFFITDLTSRSMILYSELLAQGSASYRKMIVEEINRIDKMAKAAGVLAKHVEQSLGKEGDTLSKENREGVKYIYQKVNEPFTRWIAAINPSEYTTKQMLFEDHLNKWHRYAYQIGIQFSNQLVGQAPLYGLFGRTITNSLDQTEHISIPEAENIYRRKLRKIYPKEVETNRDSNKG